MFCVFLVPASLVFRCALDLSCLALTLCVASSGNADAALILVSGGVILAIDIVLALLFLPKMMGVRTAQLLRALTDLTLCAP